MHTKQQADSISISQVGFEDLASIGEELTDQDLMLAVGGLMRVDIEVVSYDESGKVIDHQIDIFYV